MFLIWYANFLVHRGMLKKVNEIGNSELVIYTTPDGTAKLQVHLEDETVWLTLNQLSELFQKAKSTISEHINNIFEEGELPREATVRNFRTVQIEKNRSVGRSLEYYNLDVIISVGYRVKSKQGTQFRQWATKRIHEYVECLVYPVSVFR